MGRPRTGANIIQGLLPCETCGAPIGEPCKFQDSRASPTAPHAARRREGKKVMVAMDYCREDYDGTPETACGYSACETCKGQRPDS